MNSGRNLTMFNLLEFVVITTKMSADKIGRHNTIYIRLIMYCKCLLIAIPPPSHFPAFVR